MIELSNFEFFILKGSEKTLIDEDFAKPIEVPIPGTKTKFVALPKYQDDDLDCYLKNLDFDSVCRYDRQEEFTDVSQIW